MDIGEIIAWVIYLGRTSILSITGFILYASVFLPVLWVIGKRTDYKVISYMENF